MNYQFSNKSLFKSTLGGIDTTEHKVDVAKLMKHLTPTEQRVLHLRRIQEQPLRLVSKKLKISGSRVRKIEAKAISKLRKIA